MKITLEEIEKRGMTLQQYRENVELLIDDGIDSAMLNDPHERMGEEWCERIKVDTFMELLDSVYTPFYNGGRSILAPLLASGNESSSSNQVSQKSIPHTVAWLQKEHADKCKKFRDCPLYKGQERETYQGSVNALALLCQYSPGIESDSKESLSLALEEITDARSKAAPLAKSAAINKHIKALQARLAELT